MAGITLKKLDELQKLVTKKLRLELELCDLRDKQMACVEAIRANEKLRTIARMQADIWLELIPLLKERQRAKRLRGKAKSATKAHLDSAIEELGRKWSVRVNAF